MNNLHDGHDEDHHHGQVIPQELLVLNESLNAVNVFLQQQHTTSLVGGHEQYVQLLLGQVHCHVQALQRSLEGATTVMLHPHLWHSLPEELMVNIMSYLDVRTLVEIKVVSGQWKLLATTAINSKGIGTTRKAFETNQELRDAVRRYCPPLREGEDHNENFYSNLYEHGNAKQQYCNRETAEDIACTYGWPIGKWDVSKIEDFSCVFYFGGILLFNEDISLWDVSNATTMKEMFRNATSFNQTVSTWDVSNVRNMESMFCETYEFNQDISTWDVSNVTTMDGMFEETKKFNTNISAWNVSNVRSMEGMFYDALQFNDDLSGWDVSNVTNMRSMFACTDKFNQDLSTWNVSSVTIMIEMFYYAKQFDQDLSSWNISNVTNMAAMFIGSSILEEDLSNWGEGWEDAIDSLRENREYYRSYQLQFR